MNLNIFAGWVGFVGLLLGAISLGMFLVAAGTGHTGWAWLAGAAFLVIVATAIGVVAGTVHHDHKLGRQFPHFP